jgi:predicted RNA-binding Zn ribbon-like protein
MPRPTNTAGSFGERLAVAFANCPAWPGSPVRELSWDQFVEFLEATHIVSAERGANLMSLSRIDPQAAETLLARAVRLRDALRKVFNAVIRHDRIDREWIEPINEILRITEGHDELAFNGSDWKMEFVAREQGSDWLLAAIARSAAEIISEGPGACLRQCANPSCGLFFCDASRTHRRRWCSMAVCGNRHKVASFAKRHNS